MNDFLIGLLTALVATNQPVAVSNFVARTTGVVLTVPDPNDPVEKEYQKLLETDDAAQEEVDKWIRDETAFREKGAGLPDATLRARIEQRFKAVRDTYEGFLRNHPEHARAHLAYGSFLMEIHDEDEAVNQMEKARDLDPKNPELNPTETVYYQNLATTVFLFRPDAMEFYKIDEPQVFDKALELYRKAMKLDPDNCVLASDYAMSYYGIKPMRTADAIAAWESALKIAPDDKEREGVYIHLARIKLNAERFEEAHRLLNSVTNEMYASLKNRLLRNLERQENESKGTNAPAATEKK